MKILIGSPLKQDPNVFREYLKSLDRLVIPDGVEVDRFFVVNDCPEVLDQLKPDEYTVINTGDIYTVTEQTHIWTVANLAKMSRLRDVLLERVINGGYDALFMVDTDLILHPMTLCQLISNQKDLCAEIFWTKAKPDGDEVWPNCWDVDQCAYFQGSFAKWHKPGVYRVGGTGACFLISRRAIEAGCDYSPIPCIYKALNGEDRHFCIRAYAIGFEIFVDTHYPALHLYRPSDYEKYMNGGAPDGTTY